MNRRALIFGLLALTLGMAGAYLNYEWLTKQHPETRTLTETVEVGPQTVKVIAAKTDLAVGSEIRDLQLGTVEWPAGLVPPGAFHEAEAVLNRIPRHAIHEGEPVLESALLPLGSEGGLSPIIGEGKRAVAVKVDEVIGIAGFVKPGARVDVLATIRSRVSSQSAFSKVILQDIKVLAVDQTLEKANAGDPKLVSVVTLEVDPQESQKLAFAAHEGKLQLALRNPADSEVVRTSSVSSSSLRGGGARGPSSSVQVIKGLDVSHKKF
jgi:pilus assembly protein CpaB